MGVTLRGISCCHKQPIAVIPLVSPGVRAAYRSASKLTAEARAAAGLDAEDYAVIEPADDGVRVRAANVDEQLDYEQSHGLGHVTYSQDEFLAELDSDD